MHLYEWVVTYTVRLYVLYGHCRFQEDLSYPDAALDKIAKLQAYQKLINAHKLKITSNTSVTDQS